jgi:guanosine-3',5'-bis(diphosphate) 3'-pyrophosphohydrolase
MNSRIINTTCQDFLVDVFTALSFAAVKHRNQKRKGAAGIPYINHPIEVAALLIKHMKEPVKEIIIASVLHDVLEDTDTSPEEIQQKFGADIMNLVQEVTDDMTLSSRERKSQQIAHAESLSYEARCIKIADKTCNIRDILTTRIYWSRRQKIHYVEWAIQVINRIRDTNKELIQEFNRSVYEANETLNYEFPV